MKPLLAALLPLVAGLGAALLFPAMKTPVLLAAVALAALLLTGCTSGFASKLNKMPDGRFTRVSLEETGKFSSTAIVLENAVKDNGLLTADKVAIDHTNPWVTKLKFVAEGYVVQLSAAEKRKPLPSLVTTSEPITDPRYKPAPARVVPAPARVVPTAAPAPAAEEPVPTAVIEKPAGSP